MQNFCWLTSLFIEGLWILRFTRILWKLKYFLCRHIQPRWCNQTPVFNWSWDLGLIFLILWQGTLVFKFPPLKQSIFQDKIHQPPNPQRWIWWKIRIWWLPVMGRYHTPLFSDYNFSTIDYVSHPCSNGIKYPIVY